MTWWGAYQILQWVIRLVMAPVILRRRLSPSTSLAWLTLIFFLPELGVLIYLLIGEHRLGRRRVQLHRQVVKLVRSHVHMTQQYAHQLSSMVEPEQATLIRQAESTGGMPIVRGNDVELLTEAVPTIDRIVEDIDQAQRHIHMVFYIFKPDDTGWRVARALARAAERGVKVRLLADAVGSRTLFSRGGLSDWMVHHDIEVHPALPVDPFRRKLARLDLRNHRKIVVIDGHTAYTGSQNIVDPHFGSRAGAWVDIMGRFTGPVALQIQVVFMEDWAYETGEELDGNDLVAPTSSLPPMPASPTGPHGDMAAQVVPTGPSMDESQTFRRVLLSAINVALRKVILTSPYVVLDEPTLMALTMAADRGAEVHLVVPNRTDHPFVAAAGRASFTTMLEAGIQIHRYLPGMLHSKTLTVDDSFALLGSANLDVRSFYLNFEMSVLMYGPQITREMRFVQMHYISQSRPIDLREWSRRPKLLQYADSAAALLSPLL